MPARGRLVVGQDRKRRLDDVAKIGFQRVLAPACGQAAPSERELMPDRRRDGAHFAVRFEPPNDLRMGNFRRRRGNDAGVQEVAQRHSETLRPAPLSRSEAAKSSSSPTSSSACLSRKLRYAAPKLPPLPRSRASSLTDTTAATGLPRRVTSISW